MTAEAILDRCYLEARCKIIEIAAALDRVDRGRGAEAVRRDPRLAKLRDAIGALADSRVDRAEQCQMIFSLPYEAGWKAPNA